MAVTINGSTGVEYDDGVKLIFGTGDDLELYHSSDQNYIYSTNGRINLRASEVRCEKADGSEVLAKFIADGACELRYNDSAKLATSSNGITVSGALHLDGDATFDNPTNAGNDINWNAAENKLKFEDNVSAKFGSGNDMSIYHNGSNSYITSGTGNFFVDICESSKFDVHHDGETIFAGYADGRFEAMYDGSLKLQTTSGGITVHGSVSTADLNLSNLDHTTPNEVDNTKGSWSMQEGANDLFLINRTNGKKYKFNLTEVT